MLTNALKQRSFEKRSCVTAKQQEQIFMREFGTAEDVTAEAVAELRAEFDTFDTKGEGELDEHEAMLLLESTSSRAPGE
jgi:hypothetical protein